MKPEELLAEALREGFDMRQGFGTWTADAEAMLAASPRLAAVMELGLRAENHVHEWQPGPVVSGPVYNPAVIAIVCKCGNTDVRSVMAYLR